MAIGLLNGETASEGACHGGVAAPYGTDITSRCADTVEVVRHGNVDSEILLLGLRKSVGTGDVVCDLELRELGGSIAGLVKVTLIGASTVSVDLETLSVVMATQ